MRRRRLERSRGFEDEFVVAARVARVLAPRAAEDGLAPREGATGLRVLRDPGAVPRAVVGAPGRRVVATEALILIAHGCVNFGGAIDGR